MYLKRPAGGLAFCLFYLASCFTNKICERKDVIEGIITDFLERATEKQHFRGENETSSGQWPRVSVPRSEILSWLPASVLFVGIIYAGSRSLSRLEVPLGFSGVKRAKIHEESLAWKQQKALAAASFLLAHLGGGGVVNHILSAVSSFFLVIQSVTVFLSSSCSGHSRWCWQSPLPKGSELEVEEDCLALDCDALTKSGLVFTIGLLSRMLGFSYNLYSVFSYAPGVQENKLQTEAYVIINSDSPQKFDISAFSVA
ncbi:hypothetical protein BTVI_74530 [Pitangus sulphuratus]|nr:hypothetical protein BTVI_74530 [Pitangus sulphuratus]